MHVVLLSGGSGRRLWPLSNEQRSKQFLRLIQNEDGMYESMVQRVYRQIQSVDPKAHVMITTGKHQVNTIKNQLGEQVAVCIEPERRDTFPAIALTAAYLVLEQGYDVEDVVIISPVDPYTESRYFEQFKTLEQLVQEDKANMALMGVKPTYPSEKYGYIVPGQAEDGYQRIEGFYEKPDQEGAKRLIAQGGLWNCGVFAFKLGYILEKLRQYSHFETYADVYDQYDQLPKISFDYEVVERETNCVVIEYEGMWKDLGTWNALVEEMRVPTYGKVILGSGCDGNHVINELDIPILLMGVKELIVCASADGIIVQDQHEDASIKPYVDAIQQPIMYEEEAWGTRQVIHHAVSEEGREAVTRKLQIGVGKVLSGQCQPSWHETWIVTAGKGSMTLNDRIKAVHTGDVIQVQPGDVYGLSATTALALIAVQVGDRLDEVETI